MYGGSSRRSGVSSTNTAAYSDDAHDGKSWLMTAHTEEAFRQLYSGGKVFHCFLLTKYSENPIGNLNGNPVVLDGSDYSETRGGITTFKYTGNIGRL